MNIADEIHILIEQLTVAWGSVVISCDQHMCRVSDGVIPFRQFESPTILEALRLAVEAEEVTP